MPPACLELLPRCPPCLQMCLLVLQGCPPAAPGLDELPCSMQRRHSVLAPEKTAGAALGWPANVQHTRPPVHCINADHGSLAPKEPQEGGNTSAAAQTTTTGLSESQVHILWSAVPMPQVVPHHQLVLRVCQLAVQRQASEPFERASCSPCFMSHPARSCPCQNSTSPTWALPLPKRLFSIAIEGSPELMKPKAAAD